MRNLLLELFRYHNWATLALIDYCRDYPVALLQEKVAGTDRSILHTLTHIVGTEQGYLQVLTGKSAVAPIRAGEVLSLADLRELWVNELSVNWKIVLDQVEQLDVTLPADGTRPEIPHAQDLLLLQTIQHGIDHRTQICTALSLLGFVPPVIDGWSFWDSEHHPSV